MGVPRRSMFAIFRSWYRLKLAAGQWQCQCHYPPAGAAIKSPNQTDFNRLAAHCLTHIQPPVYSQSGNCEFVEKLRREIALRDIGRRDMPKCLNGGWSYPGLKAWKCRQNLTRRFERKLMLSRWFSLMWVKHNNKGGEKLCPVLSQQDNLCVFSSDF